ncbi:MAG TPA: metal ABC transporter permease [Abditibacteriaceae bacterium]
MRSLFLLILCCCLGSATLLPGFAQSPRPEDLPLDDAPAIVAPAQKPSSPTGTDSSSEGDSQHGYHGHAHEEKFVGDIIDSAKQPSVFALVETYSKDFMRQALLAGLSVALICSYLGVYVVLKRIVFVGVALAEMSSAGIALGLLLGFAPILGAMLFTLLGVVFFSLRFASRRLPNETFIGIAYSIAAALGILLIAKSAQGETHMLKLLQGDVLTVSPRETLVMIGAFAVVGLLHVLFNKEFLLVSFDREAASTLGFRAAMWDFLLFLSIGLVIAFSIYAVGILLTSTLLVLPAATALLLANRMRSAFVLAPVFGTVPVVLGLHLSLVTDMPASAVVVALSFLLFVATFALTAARR